jgi:hypothetical protein
MQHEAGSAKLPRSRARIIGGLAPFVVLLAGCSGSTQADEPDATASQTHAAALAPVQSATKAAPTPTLLLEGSGLTLTSADGAKPQPLPYGTDQQQTIAAISSVLGKPSQQGTNDDCPAGPVQIATWSKGLSANFQDGKFVGWTGAVDIKTSRGIGFGSTRAELVKAYKPSFEQSTLGTEFLADGISGVMESDAADATISDLWSGVSCVAR